MTAMMTHKVKSARLLLRRNAGRDGEIKHELRGGIRLMLLNYEPAFRSGRKWLAIETERGARGWVDSEFIKKIEPVAAREVPEMWYSQ
jgi:hypothetical protein